MSRFSKLFIGGCLIGASFFVACQQEPNAEAQAAEATAEEKTPQPKKELEMNEPSELALLMRSMYDRNLALKKQIMDGDIPESFPEDFLNIHTAKANENLNETFDALAKEYIKNMEAITKAENREEGIQAYNNMVGTCASCHTIYCQGPLPKIRKMRIQEGES
tara:strand:+ start:1772 stop:2260 length:489 start_codon:yes stop_codon:yes gene_type:complete